MNFSNFTHPFNNVVLIAQAPQDFYRHQLIENSKQYFIGPDVSTNNINNDTHVFCLGPDDNGSSLNKKLNHYNIKPDIIFIKADATKRVNISGIKNLPGRKVLLMGDTHHLCKPLQTMISYVLSEPFDLISSEHDRHHLPLFREAGLENLIWLPCFTMNPHNIKPTQPIYNSAVFVGSLSKHHHHRRELITQLVNERIPLHITSAPQKKASMLYNSYAISLNVSLNADLNFRVMEILASGGCLLTDRLGPESGLDLLLTEDEHYVGYSSMDEAAEKIKWLIDKPSIRQQIAEAGYQRFWSEFSPAVQTRALLNFFNGESIPNLFKAPS